jgi:hypothetical protein
VVAEGRAVVAVLNLMDNSTVFALLACWEGSLERRLPCELRECFEHIRDSPHRLPPPSAVPDIVHPAAAGLVETVLDAVLESVLEYDLEFVLESVLQSVLDSHIAPAVSAVVDLALSLAPG